MPTHSPLLAYLLLRLRLLARLLREIGWVRLAVAGPLLGLSLLQAFATLARQPRGLWAVPLLLGWALLGAHRQRADARWLAAAAPGHRPWLAAEYALLGLPLALGLLALRAYGAAALTLGLAALVAWVPPAGPPAATRPRGRSPFRSEAFEWVGGARASQALWLWPGLVGLATWQRAVPLAPLAALGAWLLVVLACYGTPEPAPMLALAAGTARQFLRRRLVLGLGYAAATALPFWLLLGAGPAGWGGALGAALFWLALVSMLILAKYAFYPNVSHIRTTQGLIVAVGLLAAGQPVYPPLMLTIAGGLAWQSQRRVRRVLGEKSA